MNCKMRDCFSFDCNLGLGGECNILVGSCDYPFKVGTVYNFEFRYNIGHIPPLDGQYKFMGDLPDDKIILKHVSSRIEIRINRKFILSVSNINSQDF